MTQYLSSVEDGLPTRSSQEYAKLKLKTLETYLDITTTAMRNKNWAGMFYLDLQAGSGKNKIGKEIILGSPLMALNLEYPFTHYRFNELDKKLSDALAKRVSHSLIEDKVKIFQKDLNEVVYEICDEIDVFDKAARLKPDTWSSLNVAFIDPQGLEVKWSTVKRLAKVHKMDLIINFSTSAIVRSAGRGNNQAIDDFYGNGLWMEDLKHPTPPKRRRALIDRYRKQLEDFGYYIQENPELGFSDMSFKNSKNAEVYSLIFASKSELGDKFWKQSKKSASPRQFDGF